MTTAGTERLGIKILATFPNESFMNERFVNYYQVQVQVHPQTNLRLAVSGKMMHFPSKLRGFWINVEKIVLTAVFTCSARVLSMTIPADAKKKKPSIFLSCNQTKEAVLTERNSNKCGEKPQPSDILCDGTVSESSTNSLIQRHVHTLSANRISSNWRPRMK